MTTLCDESTALFISEALLGHAREVNRYVKSYPSILETLPAETVRSTAKTFLKNANRMFKELQALLLMASYKGVSRFCNNEQVDAYMEDTLQVIENIEKDYRESGLEIDAMPALLN